MTNQPAKRKFSESVLPSLTLEEAQQLQFQFVESISKHFTGDQFLSLGDLGLGSRYQRPEQTEKAERVLADFFGAEAAALVRGAGTGAIRILLSVLLSPDDSMFIHKAPVYATTKETIRMLGIRTVAIDFNRLKEMEKALREDADCKVFYIQHARQQPSDTYHLQTVIETVKRIRPDLTVVVDDNYCVMKTYGIGVQCGADYSTFSGFKLMGPEGIGVILGKKDKIDLIHAKNYSGGGQVQGFEAMELLRMMTLTPVLFAVQSKQVEEICRQLNEGAIEEVDCAYVVNAQSKNVIVELKEPIAPEVIKQSNRFGAATHPVGAESKYEILPLFYRVSGSFIEAEPRLKDYGIRINPMKSGAATVLRILKEAIHAAKESVHAAKK